MQYQVRMPSMAFTYGSLSVEDSFHFPSWDHSCIQSLFSVIIQFVLCQYFIRHLSEESLEVFPLQKNPPTKKKKRQQENFHSLTIKTLVLNFWLHNKWRKQQYFEIRVPD